MKINSDQSTLIEASERTIQSTSSASTDT